VEATPRDPEMLAKVQNYRKYVLIYEGLNHQIDKLIGAYGGTLGNMTPEDLEHYRTLSHQRDELFNEIRLLEQQLLADDSSSNEDKS